MSKKGCTIVLNRPIQHLYPLEVSGPSSDTSEQDSETTAGDPADDSVNPDARLSDGRCLRPQRSAAIRARDRIIAQSIYQLKE